MTSMPAASAAACTAGSMPASVTRVSIASGPQILANVTLPIFELSASTTVRADCRMKAWSVCASISSWVVQPSVIVKPSVPTNVTSR